MCIIIHNGNACHFTLVLETAVCTCEASKSLHGNLVRDLKKLCQCNRSQCIGNIVAARNLQIEASGFLTILHNGEGSVTVFVIGDISSLILCVVLQAVCNDLAGKSFDNFLIARCVRIDDQGSVRWQQLGKFAEGMTDVVNILEKVQMVCVNVQDNADLRENA